jgi:hypothetical protein
MERLKPILRARELKIQREKTDRKYKSYQFNSLKFTTEVCGERVPDCIKPIFNSWDSNQKTVVVSANGVGKSWAGARLSRASYICFDKAEIYLAAAPPINNLERILWKEIKVSVSTQKLMFSSHRLSASMKVTPYGDSDEDSSRIIQGLVIPSTGDEKTLEAKFSGKHAPFLGFVLDEADAIPRPAFQGIDACASGGITRQVFFFNPRKQAGPVWEMIRGKTANIIRITAFDHPNVITGEDLFPGAVTRQITIQRIHNMTREIRPGETPNHEFFEVPDFLVGKTTEREDGNGYFEPLKPGWRKITNNEFYYKVLAKFPAQTEQQLISRVHLQRAFDNYKKYVKKHGDIPPKIQPTLGYDVAGGGKDLNVVSAKYGSFIDYVDEWDGVDPDAGATRAGKTYDKLGAKEIFIDANGVGSGSAPKLRREGLNATGVMVSKAPSQHGVQPVSGKFFQTRDQLAWAVREWLRTDENACLPYSQEIEEEFLVWDYEEDGGVVKITRAKDVRELLNRSPDKFWSVALHFAQSESMFIPEFNTRIHSGPFTLRLTNRRHWKIYGAFHYSARHPSCFILSVMAPNRVLYITNEIYRQFDGVKSFGKSIYDLLGQLNINPDGLFSGQEIKIEAPKDGMAGTSQTIFHDFSKMGLIFVRGNNTTVNQWEALRKKFRARDYSGKPVILINNVNCPFTIETISNLKFPEAIGKGITSNFDPDPKQPSSAAYCLAYLSQLFVEPEERVIQKEHRPIGEREMSYQPLKFS